MSQPPPLRIGLSLAGAASAGAYSAGALDFLLEALFSLHAVAPPPWPIHLAEIVGTSAGGINAALAAAALNSAFVPLSRDPLPGPPAANPFYDTWVREMDFRSVCDTSDLAPPPTQPRAKPRVRSLLNADFTKNSALRVLRAARPISSLPSWAPNLRISITATSLRGVPYTIRGFTSQPDGRTSDFHMRHYADYTSFRLVERPTADTDHDSFHLDMSVRDGPSWSRLIECARATSAFPLAFPTVALNTPRSFYEHRLLDKPSWTVEDEQEQAFRATSPRVNLDATSASTQPNQVHVYAALDGGVFDNTPFGLVRKNLLDSDPDGGQGDTTHASTRNNLIILIDPFPSTEHDPNVVQDFHAPEATVIALVQAMRGHASFQSDELAAAANDGAVQKYMIQPRRSFEKRKFPLATTTLHAFGGLIHESIRLHDFQLGRRNCQRFLSTVFGILREDVPSHPVLGHPSCRQYVDQIHGDFIPFIPLVGFANHPVARPKWPAFDRLVVKKQLMTTIEKRISKIIELYFEQLDIVSGTRRRSILWNPIQVTKKMVANAVRSSLERRLSSAVGRTLDHALTAYDHEVDMDADSNMPKRTCVIC